MAISNTYPIGSPGQPWTEVEVGEWRARQPRRRRYDEDVVSRIEALDDRYETVIYGELDYADDRYQLLAVRSRPFDSRLQTVLVTGGVHGYESSGITGALEFLEQRAPAYFGRVNLLVVPCVSPWGYERINRWNYDAVDPNRNFRIDGPSQEARALIGLVRSVQSSFLMHIDLHETTDSDEEEFMPALAARDGKVHEPGIIPDGFYLIANSENPQLAFQQAIISAVERVTKIAPPDDNDEIIGLPSVAHGVVAHPIAQFGICASITGARFTTTTEVYPDSADCTAEECNEAQVTAICAGLDFALSDG